MQRALLMLVGILSIAVAAASAQDKCFENNGLKDGHSIEMSITGKTVTGSFGIAPDYDTDRVKWYDFTGTIAGSVISVKFPDQTPVEFPSSPSTKRWTLVRTASGEKLRVTLYGKNYNTNKWGNYTADYTSCKSEYDEVVAAAKRITFAKGTTSWTSDVTLASQADKKSFRLGLRAGQRVSVSAIGCGISFYYPDKTPYEEGTAVDMWGSDKLPQTGDYLFVISPAGEPGRCSVKFDAK